MTSGGTLSTFITIRSNTVLPRNAREYPHCSFGEFVAQGLYDETWGALDDDLRGTEFGE